MTLEEGLRAHLLADAGVSALTTRVLPEFMRQGTGYPAITYALIGEQRQNTLGGPMGLITARIEIDCFAGQDYDQAKELAAAVLAALDGHTGSLGGFPVQYIYSEGGARDLAEVDGDREERRVSIDFAVIYSG